MNILLKTIQIETFKIFKIKTLNIILFFPVIVSIFVIYLTHNQISEGQWSGDNFWKTYYYYFLMLYSFFLPVIIAATISIQMGIEYKNNAFQMLFTLPIQRYNVLISKLLVLMCWVFMFLLIVFMLIFFTGTILVQLYSDKIFFEHDLYLPVIQFFIKIYMASITIGIFHLFFSYCNMTSQISILTASFLSVISILSANWKYSYINPYSWIYNLTKDFNTYEVNHWFSKEIYFMFFYFIILFFTTLTINQNKKKFNLWT